MTDIFDELIKKRQISETFLHPKYNLELTDELSDIDKAVTRIEQSIERKEKVLVYGDYDVDGVTASTLMHDCLKLSGVEQIFVMLPDRFIDGYGMSKRVIKRAKELGVSLIITVDCGSNNAEIIDELSLQGIDVIVTDHHEIMKEIPKSAVAVVNPKREKQTKLRELCGCGVAFMVMQKMVKEKKIPEGYEKWFLDLVLIGTLCDSMTIDLTNRMLSYFGMKILKKTKRPGLVELLKSSRANKINSETIGYQIGPRLNASGRMETAEISLKLLMSENHREASELAMKLNQLNLERRNSQQQALLEIPEVDDPVIVVTGKWHEGILGIIAGKLVEKFHKPAFVLSEVEKGVLKGSGRAFGEFNLAEALRKCEKEIISGGGHAAACGLKVGTDKIDDFRRKVNGFYKSLQLTDQEKYLEPQADIILKNLDGLTIELMDEIKSLEPFGIGNLEPIFQLKEMEIIEMERMGLEKQHLKLVIQDEEGHKMKLIAFNAPEIWMNLSKGERKDIWINLLENEWQNVKQIEGRILQIK